MPLFCSLKVVTSPCTRSEKRRPDRPVHGQGVRCLVGRQSVGSRRKHPHRGMQRIRPLPQSLRTNMLLSFNTPLQQRMFEHGTFGF